MTASLALNKKRPVCKEGRRFKQQSGRLSLAGSAMSDAPQQMRFALTLALCVSLLGAQSAVAQSLLGSGELSHLEALIAWEGGEELLILSPRVRDGGVFVMAFPDGTRLLPLREEASLWMRLAPPAREEGGLLTAEQDIFAEEPAAPRSNEATAARKATLPGAARLSPSFKQPLGAALQPIEPSSTAGPQDEGPVLRAATELLLLPEQEAMVRLKRWGFGASLTTLVTTPAAPIWLIARIPSEATGVQLKPIGLRFSAVWPRLPLRPAQESLSYVLSLSLLAASKAIDLGGADLVFRLRRQPYSPTLAPSLQALLAEQLPTPRIPFQWTQLSAARLSPAAQLQGDFGDLRIPPPYGSRAAPIKEESKRRGLGPTPATPKGEGAARTTSDSGTKSTGSCGACASARGKAGGVNLALIFGVIIGAQLCLRSRETRSARRRG